MKPACRLHLLSNDRFDLLYLLIAERGLIRKVESQPIRIHFTSLLLSVTANSRLQCMMQNVCR